MRRAAALLLGMLGSLSLAAAEPAPLPDGLYAEFNTTAGTFTARLFFEQAPLTCGSFVGLAEGTLAPRHGQPFYTGLKWYRVVPNFVLQSGDPTNPGGGMQDRPPQSPADEEAGHPYQFPDEIVPGFHHDAAGVLSMANAGPDTNSSEFFVTLRETNRLNYLHSVFGRVERGLEVLDRVKQGDPLAIRIIRVGPAAQAFRADQAALQARMAAARAYAGPREPGPAAPFDDPDKVLPVEPPRAKNFNFKLANFERFTGRRLAARVLAKFTPEQPGQKPGEFNAALARRLGINDTGVLATYFADTDTWHLWIGERWLERFVGRSGTRAELVDSGALMKRKEEFIAAARARAAEVAARSRAEGRTVDQAQLIKLTVDEVLDALILLYESQP